MTQQVVSQPIRKSYSIDSLPRSWTKLARTLNYRPKKQAFLILLVGCFLFLAACSAAASSAPKSTAKATPSAPTIPAGTVLYQADWSHGFGDWQVSGGWKAVNGYLQSDGSNNISITAPYRPTMPNYAIEVRVQVVSVPKDGGFFILSADPMPGRDGYQAAVSSLLMPGQDTSGLAPQLDLTIDPISSMDEDALQVHDYQPGSDWRTYSVEVRESRAIFLVDGARNSQAVSNKTVYLSNGPIHLKCGIAILRVSNFRIIAL